MSEDGRLLQQYRQQGSEAAFARLAARHLNFVYATCLRETGDAALAEEAAQVVFLLPARKAPSVRPGQSLSGWLFQTARFAARNARRREERRKAWEERAVEQMPPAAQEADALWDRLGPTVNDALAALGAKDREAVLLRFADGLSFPELGAALGTSEDAARMRLNRAVDRLRRFFANQGVTLSAAVLVSLLADRVAQAAPVTCTAAVARIAESVALGTGDAVPLSPNVHSQLQGALKAMMTAKLKVAAIAALTVTLAGTLPFVTRAQKPLSGSAPVTAASTAASAAPSSGSISSFAVPGAQTGNSGTVSQMQVQTYTSGRSYNEVCQFYSRAFLDGDFRTLGVTGVRGNNDTHSVYALHQKPGAQTAVFCQRTPKYFVSAFVTRGAGESETEVTLVYEPK